MIDPEQRKAMLQEMEEQFRVALRLHRLRGLNEADAAAAVLADLKAECAETISEAQKRGAPPHVLEQLRDVGEVLDVFAEETARRLKP